jgi:hypothetical protein
MSAGAKINRTDKKDEGKAVHDVAHQCLEFGYDPDDFLGKESFDMVITDDMVESAALYVNYIRQFGGQHYYELPIAMTSVSNRVLKGTADCIIIDGDLMRVIDLKNGRSPVEVKRNWQLIGYALAAIDTLGG